MLAQGIGKELTAKPNAAVAALRRHGASMSFMALLLSPLEHDPRKWAPASGKKINAKTDIVAKIVALDKPWQGQTVASRLGLPSMTEE